MSDQRNLTMGLRFEVSESASGLSGILETIQEIKAGFQGAEDRGEEFGTQTAHSAGMAAEGLRDARGESDRAREAIEDLSDSGEEAGETMQQSARRAREAIEDLSDSGSGAIRAWREMGAEASGFGDAVIKASGQAIKETNSVTKAIQAGFQGAYSFATKQADRFEKKLKTGASGIKNTILHPIQTIKDKLSDTIEKAGARIGQAGREADEAGDSIKDMGDAGESAGSRIKDAVGSAVQSFFAISAAVELVKAGIEAAKSLAGAIFNAGVEADRTGAKFGAMFDTDSGVSEWADNFSEAVHRSSVEVQGFLVSNKAMYQELGVTGQAADDLSKITTSLAYDFGSAFKMEDAEALSVIQDYINGNTSALNEYGFQLDDAALKQSALAMGIQGGIEELDDAAAVQVRMNALLENSGAIQQAAAKKQEGYANGIKSLKGIWSGFLNDAGERFAPVFTELTDTVLMSWPQVEPALMGMADMLADGFAAGLPVMAELATSAIPMVIQTLGDLAGAAAPVGGALVDLATTALPPLVSAAGPIIETLGTLAQAVLPPLSKVIGDIASTAVPPLVSILKSLSENVIAPLMPHIESIANAILPALSSGLELIPPVLEIISPILSGIADVLSNVVGFLGKIAEWAAGGLGSLLDKAASFLGAGTGAKSTGAQIPHNADGDDNFDGGWTHINEQGGELAFLPSGSAIIPADKSEQILSGIRSQNITLSAPFNPAIALHISGSVGAETISTMKEELWRTMEEFWKEKKEEEAMALAIQQGNA